jgi:hypothetical protein
LLIGNNQVISGKENKEVLQQPSNVLYLLILAIDIQLLKKNPEG